MIKFEISLKDRMDGEKVIASKLVVKSLMFIIKKN